MHGRIASQHKNESCHTHHGNALCHTHKRVMSQHMNKSCHTREWFVLHPVNELCRYAWTSHGTCMQRKIYVMRTQNFSNESCHTHGRVMSHTWMSRVTTDERVMPHTWTSHGTHTQENLYGMASISRLLKIVSLLQNIISCAGLLQKRPMILRSLVILATPYMISPWKKTATSHVSRKNKS